MLVKAALWAMKAAWRSHYGPPENLIIKDLPLPAPQKNEILVRVMATTVNRTDCAILSAKPFIMRFFTGFLKPKSPVPGTDFAGVVEAIGQGVTRFKVGEKIWGFDDQGLGSQAQYFVLPETKAIAVIPDGINFADAAASAEGAHYAYNFLNKITIVPGQKILVNGATGAIGSALVQFLKGFQVQITAVCATQHMEKVKSLGAEHVIDYLHEDFTAGAGGYDFILDAVGKSTFGRCRRLLAPKGIYISSELGPGGQNIFLPLITMFSPGKRVVFPLPTDISRSMLFVRDLLVKKTFRPMIDREFPLNEIAAAYSYAASGKKAGNIIINYT